MVSCCFTTGIGKYTTKMGIRGGRGLAQRGGCKIAGGGWLQVIAGGCEQ